MQEDLKFEFLKQFGTGGEYSPAFCRNCTGQDEESHVTIYFLKVESVI